MKLGEKIKLLRSEKELTQPDLAEKAGIEQSYLSKLENDKSVPSFDIINRIAMALETTGMELIDSLSHSYIEENLAHIPEVAAEYANIKFKREASMKKRFILASIVVVVGVGVFLLGAFPAQQVWNYSSKGIIAEGEILDHFSGSPLREIGETMEEFEERVRSNKDRFDESFYLSKRFRGTKFDVDVEGGRRLFRLESASEPATGIAMGLHSIIGIMLIVSGFFAFLFNIRFKP